EGGARARVPARPAGGDEPGLPAPDGAARAPGMGARILVGARRAHAGSSARLRRDGGGIAMRQDQFEALQKRAEELIDAFLRESNPAEWPGAGIKPAQMQRETRGDLYWCKKNAVATLACAQRIIGLVDLAREKSAGGEDNPGAVT